MIVSVKVDNFRGIENEANISAIASNKIKRDKNSCSYIDEKNKLLKKIGIIGCNGSGKTSLLSAIHTIQTYLSFPYRKDINNDDEFKNLLNTMSEKNLKDYLLKFNTLKLGPQNINRSEETTKIEIELYAPKRENNIPGFYKYIIEYDKNHSKNGVILEALYYREKINSKKFITLSKKNNIIESNISTTVLYENNNIKLENINYINYYKSFLDEIIEYTDCFFEGGSFNLKEFFNNHKKEFIKLCNIADDKITNITIDKNSNEVNILFWNNNNKYLYFTDLSEGTRKIIILGCTIINSLYNNSVSIIDEIEQSLHHSLTQFLIELISAKGDNNYSQIIFTTHSPLLAFSLSNDELYFIHNHDNNYYFSNITNAIKMKLITKDQNVQKACIDNILIKNPDNKTIYDFIKKTKF